MKIGTFTSGGFTNANGSCNGYIIIVDMRGDFWGINRTKAFHSRALLIEKKNYDSGRAEIGIN